MKILKTLKTIFLILLLIPEALLSVLAIAVRWEDYPIERMISMVLFGGFSIVTFAELIRIKRGKEKILLPMLGMYAVIFIFAFSIGLFAEYHYSGDGNALSAGIALAVLSFVLTGAGYGIRYILSKSSY